MDASTAHAWEKAARPSGSVRRRTSRRWSAVLIVGLLLVAGCGKADDDEGASGEQKSSEESAASKAEAAVGDLLWDDGPCDTSKPRVELGMIATFNASSVSMEAQAAAGEVAAESFNARGGINGQCISVTTCDDKGNPNAGAKCARDLLAQGVVAELNDSVTAGQDAVVDLFTKAGVARLDGNPAVVAFESDLTYSIGAGGFGTAIAHVPALARGDAHKLALIRPDIAGAAAIPSVLKPVLGALDSSIVADIPVPTGTSDFSQFVLAAQRAGADGVILLVGPHETMQVLRAAKDLSSEMTYSVGLATISRESVAELGDFASQLVFSGEVPAATADPERFPLMAVAVSELAASGEPDLGVDSLTSLPVKSWVYLFGLVSILRDAKPSEVTSDAVVKALNAAVDVDMGGLIPPWTPNAESEGIFRRVSNPYYWTATWDPEQENFVMDAEQVNVVELLAGNAG